MSHQYVAVDGPFTGELCELDLEAHINEIALRLDEGRVAIYRLDGDAAFRFVSIDSCPVDTSSLVRRTRRLVERDRHPA